LKQIKLRLSIYRELYSFTTNVKC